MTAMTLPACAAEQGGVDLSELYYAQRLPLTRLAVLLLGDLASAEDAVQEVFAKLWARGDLLDRVENPVGYLRTAVANHSRSMLRRRKTVRNHTPLHVPDVEPAEATALLPMEHQEVLEAMRQLPRRQREVLTLRYWSDLSEVEIAQTLGVSRGTVKSTASRGLRALGEILKG